MPKPNYFIFITADGQDFEDKKISAKEIALSRLGSSEWPLYRGTGHISRLKPLDRCLFYIAGSLDDSQCIIGAAQIKKLLTPSVNWNDPCSSLLSDIAAKVALLEQIEVWEQPISIRHLIQSLKFITNKKRWGVHLIGGVKRISKEDYFLCITQSKA